VREGLAVDIPGGNVRTVTAASPVADYTNIASGADCTLTETRSGGASSWRVLDGAGDPVTGGDFTITVDPSILSATDQAQGPLEVENTFRFAEIALTKFVRSPQTDANGNPIARGPFEVQLACTLDGRDIQAAESSVRSVADGQTITWTELAEGAECDVKETSTGGATSTQFQLTSAGGSLGAPILGTLALLPPLRSTSDPIGNPVLLTNSFALASTGFGLDARVPLAGGALLLSGALLLAWAALRRRRGVTRRGRTA